MTSQTWTTVVAIEGFIDQLPGDIPYPIEIVAEPPAAVDEKGRLHAQRVARAFALPAAGWILVLTGRDLCAGNCSWVFGYSDRRSRVAVVSTCRFRDPNNPAVTTRRLAGVAAHELGHLSGLAHCGTHGCVMNPARDPTELDARGLQYCGRCPSPFRFLHLAAGLAACLLLFLCLDMVGRELKPDRTSPFSVHHSPASQSLRILFKGKPVISLSNPSANAPKLEEQLNTAYRNLHAPRFEVDSAEAALTVIRLNGSKLLEVTATDAGGEPPATLAERWSHSLEELVDGKGPHGEGCYECHVNRRAEVVAWARARGR
jgi:hypothetical protein